MKLTLQLLFLTLVSANLFGGNSIFSYEKMQLENDFSQLILLEEYIGESEMTLTDIQNNEDLVASIGNTLFQDDRCAQGRSDAAINYKASGPAIGVFCCTAGTNPVFGIILALIVNSKPPKDANLKLTNYSLLNESDYISCYRAAAHEKKKKAVWLSVGIGSAIYLVAVIYNYTVLQ